MILISSINDKSFAVCEYCGISFKIEIEFVKQCSVHNNRWRYSFLGTVLILCSYYL
jgi:hypothetical protein